MAYEEYDFSPNKLIDEDYPKLLRASYVELSKNPFHNQSTSHSHDFVEIFFVKQNVCKFQVNQTIMNLQRGDIVIVFPRHEHCEIATDNNTILYIIAMDDFKSENENGYIKINANKNYNLVSLYFESIFNELKNKREYSDTICQNLAQSLFLLLKRGSLEIIHQETFNYNTIEEAKNFIDKNFTQKIKIIDMANNIFLSEEHFIRKFKKFTGVSPLKYLNSLRLNKSRDALIYTNKSVISISIDIGYSDVTNYIKKFKENFGITPIQFRNNHRAKNKEIFTEI